MPRFAHRRPLPGTPATVARPPHDGDSIRVVVVGDDFETVIRLSDVDAPELGKPHGAEARAYVRSVLSVGELVGVELGKPDRYRRTLAIVHHDDHRVLNDDLVARGWAWRYHTAKRPDLASLEGAARAAGLGLWADPGAVEPRAWRKR